MIKISIVEDQPDIRKSLVRNITRTEGLICLSDYGTAEEALINLPLDQPDLVLMDIGLPKMSGIECMIRIALKDIKIDFLMFTVSEHDEEVFEALKAGAIGYVLKEDGQMGPIKAIKEYQAGGAPMSRNIAKKVLQSFKTQKNASSKSFENLTEQQFIILQLLAEGLLNKEIADRLDITERTVKQHNNAIYKKLQVNNRTEAVLRYLKNNSRFNKDKRD